MSALDTVLSALRSHRCDPRPNGSGYAAKCPAHPDRNPSLSVSNGAGRVLVNCHAGCSGEAVVDALGLSMTDLFDEPKIARREVAAYTYEDEHGTPLFEVVRFEPKDFRQRQPDGTWGVKGVRKVLYRLPAVLAIAEAGGTIYVCEGEKDADAINAVEGNHVATCNAGGAGKWRDDYSAALRGSSVIIVQDKDEPGRAHATAVAASLRGVAASCRIVEAREGKDAADHLAAGHGLEDFVPVGSDLENLEIADDDDGGFVDAADLLAARIEAPPQILPGWALPDVHLFAGPSYSGKTLEAYQIAAQLALGHKVLGEWRYPRPVNSLFVQAEMTAAESQLYLQRVCDGLGISPSALRGKLSFLGHEHGFNFRNANDLARLQRILAERYGTDAQIGLVFVDSISECAGIESQDSREDVRGFFRDFVRPWARQYECGVAAAHHTNKQALAKVRMVDDQALVSGSEAFISAVNSARLVLRVAKEPAQRFVRIVKGRASRAQKSFLYNFVNPPGPHDPVRLDFHGFVDETKAAEATTDPTPLDRVKDFLREHPGRTFTRAELIDKCKVGHNVPGQLPPEFVAAAPAGKNKLWGLTVTP